MLYKHDDYQAGSFTSVTFAEKAGETDEELMADIANEDEAALTTLYRRHFALFRTIIGRVINNDADVDELLQEVFLEIWRQASHYNREKGKALGWMVTLARRRAIDRVRRKQAYQRAQDRMLDETKGEWENSIHQSADNEVAAADQGEILHRVVARLPDAQREALQLAYFNGMSQREIAAHTGIPLGTIKTRIELATRKVKSAILALGGAGEWSPAAA